ncbi:MAG: histidine--tRNA ligase [Calditerrivibrio sp.]|nr:histidine--tRNA ligase [Calditerrivibrio sp.]
MFTKVKGFRDIFDEEIGYWNKVEKIFYDVFKKYDYTEFKLPILEKVELFKRGIGDTTDIVEKEMFVFDDKGGEKLALRPEGTASIVRAYIENKLYSSSNLSKYYYYGPMFRRERPQKGRFRQFTQVGVEVFGSNAPAVDAEVMKTMSEIFDKSGISNLVKLNINSLGCPDCRPDYRKKLISFLNSKRKNLCEDCKNRLEKNPLRVLDCKLESCKAEVVDAPLMIDNLCPTCFEHFEDVKGFLNHFGVNYEINPFMVRGLDYYVRTAFEFTTDFLGASNAVGGGGRYDGLIKTLGGPDIPGIGYAIGVDRLVALMMEKKVEIGKRLKVFIIFFKDTMEDGFYLIDKLRSENITTIFDYEIGSLKSQFKKADKSGADIAIIVGSDEKERGIYTIKNMRNGTQKEIKKELIINEIKNITSIGGI